MFDWLPFSAKKRQQKARAQALYIAIVDLSRNAELFQACQIPDTVDGRFDVLSLHLFIVLRHIKTFDGLDDFADEVASVFATDMDRNLREMGVGDLSVGKHVKKMSAAFMGRFIAYDKAMKDNDADALSGALKRNIFRDAPVDPKLLATLTAFTQQLSAAVAQLSIEDCFEARLPHIAVASVS